MDKQDVFEKIILDLTVITDKRLLIGIAKVIAASARVMGMDERDLLRLESAVFEAGTNVIDHAFEKDVLGEFKIMLIERPGKLVVVVEDRGMPMDIDKVESGQEIGIGWKAMHAFADQVTFNNQGHKGKRVEMIKNLPLEDIKKYLNPHDKRGIFSGDVPEDKLPTTSRLLRPEDVVSLARCVYRTYGYTYMDDFYYPEKIRQSMASGNLMSFVMNDEQGEVIAHAAIVKPFPGAKVGEIGRGFVSPNYRGKGLLKIMVKDMVSHAKKEGLYGFYGEALTVHPYSQKSLLSMGGVETGFLIGFVPGNVDIGLDKERMQKRNTLCIIYYRLNEEPERELYFPEHHSKMLGRIYQKLGLKRKIVNEVDSVEVQRALPDKAKLNISINHELQNMTMSVTQYGLDIVEHVAFMLREGCLHKNACIYLELPLSDPATRVYSERLEDLGFFFSGIAPEMENGDVLRLQYLNNLEIDYHKIIVAGDFGKEILEYIQKANERVVMANIEITNSREINLRKIRSEGD